jgi:hypothetical protein
MQACIIVFFFQCKDFPGFSRILSLDNNNKYRQCLATSGQTKYSQMKSIAQQRGVQIATLQINGAVDGLLGLMHSNDPFIEKATTNRY